MKVKTDPEFNAKIGAFRVGVVASEHVECQETSAEFIQLLQKQEEQIKKSLSLEVVNKVPNIHLTREAYKKLGNDPNRYRPSADSLMRRIVKGLGLYYINNVVDVLNLVSLESGFSIGGYDYDKIEEEIELGIGRKNEIYYGIGRGQLNIENLPVLRDHLGAFGTPTSDSQRTMITRDTSSIFFVFYDFGRSNLLPETLNHCAKLLKIYCSAEKPNDYIMEFPEIQ